MRFAPGSGSAMPPCPSCLPERVRAGPCWRQKPTCRKVRPRAGRPPTTPTACAGRRCCRRPRPAISRPSIRICSSHRCRPDLQPGRRPPAHPPAGGCRQPLRPAGHLLAGRPGLTARHAFFRSLGTNGRSCATCHQPPSGMSFSLRNVRARFGATAGTDPIFAPVDGANCPDAVPAQLHLRRALWRAQGQGQEGAQGRLLAAARPRSDPRGDALASYGQSSARVHAGSPGRRAQVQCQPGLRHGHGRRLGLPAAADFGPARLQDRSPERVGAGAAGQCDVGRPRAIARAAGD